MAKAGDHGREIHIRWMDTGQTALVTNVESAPKGLAWSPDGESIAFSAFVEEERTTLVKPPKKPEGAEWAPGVVVIDSLNYRRDGQGIVKPGNDHVFVVPADGGTARQLTEGDYDYDGRLAWSPDGDRIVVSVNRHELALRSARYRSVVDRSRHKGDDAADDPLWPGCRAGVLAGRREDRLRRLRRQKTRQPGVARLCARCGNG
ncbi:MAG: hypothetical protein U5O39_02275 [Gammaproteobacteria bacterium]|nr:hypothetical protein [Gammaproteobacteria bacterium]